MAKKGQRFNKYPEELKEALRQAYLNGEETCNSIARKYSVPLNTAHTWTQKWNHPEKLIPISLYQ